MLATPQPQQWQKSLVISLAFHFFVIALFFLQALFLPSEPLSMEDAIRVDLIALPDKPREMEISDITPPKPVAIPITVEKTTTKPIEKPAAKTVVKKIDQKTPQAKPKKLSKTELAQQKNAIARLQALAKIADAQKPQPPEQFKGNVLSDGSSLKGLQKLQHNEYLSKVRKHINKNWFLPEWLAREKLRATVRVKIDENGNLLDRQIETSSNNKEFDELALATIQKASPFPAPPGKFVDLTSVKGLLLGFPE